MQPAASKARALLRFLPMFVVALIPQTTAIAADLAREQRITEQISEAILDGETVLLEAQGTRFLGIHTRTDWQKARGAALILHGRDANPDWLDIVHPLRISLPQYGWDTLSIQLPLAPEGASDAEWWATIPEALPRLAAAIGFLQQQGVQNIVLISHSFGNHAAARYLGDRPSHGIRAWVGVGMPIESKQRENGTLSTLRQLELPILDLYGENDLATVVASAGKRRLAARDAGNGAFEQREIGGGDHFFSGQDDLLVNIVKSWLAKTADAPRAAN